jgi:hypothetical protein
MRNRLDTTDCGGRTCDPVGVRITGACRSRRRYFDNRYEDHYDGRGTLVTLEESIQINKANGVKHTPELKGGNPDRINAILAARPTMRRR